MQEIRWFNISTCVCNRWTAPELWSCKWTIIINYKGLCKYEVGHKKLSRTQPGKIWIAVHSSSNRNYADGFCHRAQSFQAWGKSPPGPYCCMQLMTGIRGRGSARHIHLSLLRQESKCTTFQYQHQVVSRNHRIKKWLRLEGTLVANLSPPPCSSRAT